MKILLIGHVDYRFDNAAKLRCLEVGRVLTRLGHEVTVYSGHNLNFSSNVAEFRDMHFVSRQHPKNRTEALACRIGLGFSLFWHEIAREKFDAIYCYGSELSWQIAGSCLAQRMDAHMLVDVTELQGIERTFTNFSQFRSRIGSWIGMFGWIPLFSDAVAAPSMRFVSMMRRLHRNVFLLPPFFRHIPNKPLHDEWQVPKKTRQLRLAYAGNPSGKEQLPLIFQALACLPERDDHTICFDIAGLYQDQITNIIREAGADSLLERADFTITCFGLIPVEQARTIIAAADYLVVIRNITQRVNFGFPSKVAEAFCMGIPVISNDYSDMAHYLKSNCNGFLVNEDSLQSLRDCFIHCQNTSDSERQAMRQAARKTGEKFFSDSSVEPTLTRMLKA